MNNLMLAEDLLLLLIKEKNGKIPLSLNKTLCYGIPGAILMDLKLMKKIVIEDSKIKVIDSEKTNCPLLDQIVQIILENEDQNSDFKYWIKELSLSHKTLKKCLLASLEEKQFIRQYKKKFLWLFELKRYEITNKHYREKLVKYLRKNIENFDQMDRKAKILLSILRGCQNIEDYCKELNLKDKDKLNGLLNEEVGKTINTIIAEYQERIYASFIDSLYLPHS